MTPSAPVSSDPLADRLRELRRMLTSGQTGALEAFEPSDTPPPLSPRTIQNHIDQTRGELHRIVRDYLDGQPHLYRLADEITSRGRRAMETIERDGVDAVVREAQLLGDFETIVRTDGSRPSFLIRHGAVDTRSSPMGDWRLTLEGDAPGLALTLACVGRINRGPAPATLYDGTGFLVAPNLLLTNRHVLQQFAWWDETGWHFTGESHVDFGHEYRARESVQPRRLRRVVFAPSASIELGQPVNHARLDLAAIELEPMEGPPPAVLSVDLAADWATQFGAEVYTIGYPSRPPTGTFTPNLLEQLFQTTFTYKRLAPGRCMTTTRSNQSWTATHDATTLGGNSGSVILMAGRVSLAAGLHYGGTRSEPAENWGHVLGLTLQITDDRGRTLRDVFAEFDVELVDRNISPT